jgi:putative ABC transport system substrate-binding protein
MTQRRPDVVFGGGSLTLVNRKQLIEFAATHRLPAMYEFSINVQDGGLMSYGPNPASQFRRAAYYVQPRDKAWATGGGLSAPHAP